MLYITAYLCIIASSAFNFRFFQRGWEPCQYDVSYLITREVISLYCLTTSSYVYKEIKSNSGVRNDEWKYVEADQYYYAGSCPVFDFGRRLAGLRDTDRFWQR